MNSEDLENKYQSLLDRIESIKKKVYIRHTVELLNQVREFCSQKKETNAFTKEVYEQQTKNLDKIESMNDDVMVEMKDVLNKTKNDLMKKTWISDDKSQKYVGEFKGEKKHGQGTYTWIGKGEISGIFEEDQFPNYGTFIDFEDHKYVGEMKERNGKYNGKGTFVHFKEKYKYEGEFKDSQRHGYGTFVQEDGSTFKGNWKNGLKHGKGTLVNAVFFRSGEEKGEEFVIDGGPQTGEYIEDHPHGIFNWEMDSGRKYVGEIKGGFFHGKGTLTHPDGKVEKGIWENGKLIKNEGTN